MGPCDKNLVVRQALFPQVPCIVHQDSPLNIQPRGQVIRFRVARINRILQMLQLKLKAIFIFSFSNFKIAYYGLLTINLFFISMKLNTTLFVALIDH